MAAAVPAGVSSFGSMAAGAADAASVTASAASNGHAAVRRQASRDDRPMPHEVALITEPQSTGWAVAQTSAPGKRLQRCR